MLLTPNPKQTNDWHYKSAGELVAALANKDISAVELLAITISRIEALDKKINAVVVRDFEQARKAAIAADKAIAQGERLPLLGLPMTVKESFNIKGLPTSWGNVLYKDWQPQEDALTVQRLKNAGAIIIGKTNVAPMLGDWQSTNEIYGTTNNPWNFELTPGGSSGGSAAALAAGFVSLELGSDLAGSLRAPAHYCGVLAHKPSADLVPMRGAGLPTSPPTPIPVDLVVAGPMARTTSDLILELNILAGPDERWNGKGYKLALPPARYNRLNEFRVLIIDKHPLCPTATAITDAIEKLAAKLVNLGVKVSRDTKNPPDLAQITQTYAPLLAAFVTADVPIEIYQKFQATARKVAVNDNSLSAHLTRGTALTYRDWNSLMRMRGQLRQQWRNLFKDFDVVICPPMPTPAFPHDHSKDIDKRIITIDGEQIPYNYQFIWVCIATLFGLPATVIPIDSTATSLPLGIQIIGDYLEDYTTLEFAKLLESELGGFVKPSL